MRMIAQKNDRIAVTALRWIRMVLTLFAGELVGHSPRSSVKRFGILSSREVITNSQFVARKLVDTCVGPTVVAQIGQRIIKRLDSYRIGTIACSQFIVRAYARVIVTAEHDRHVVAVEYPADIVHDCPAVVGGALHLPSALEALLIVGDGGWGLLGRIVVRRRRARGARTAARKEGCGQQENRQC